MVQLAGSNGQSSVADMARLEKHLKGRLAAAAEHFNRDQKKGLQYLQVCVLCVYGGWDCSTCRWMGGWEEWLGCVVGCTWVGQM